VLKVGFQFDYARYLHADSSIISSRPAALFLGIELR
jgi:hypothetical protein